MAVPAVVPRRGNSGTDDRGAAMGWLALMGFQAQVAAGFWSASPSGVPAEVHEASSCRSAARSLQARSLQRIAPMLHLGTLARSLSLGLPRARRERAPPEVWPAVPSALTPVTEPSARAKATRRRLASRGSPKADHASIFGLPTRAIPTAWPVACPCGCSMPLAAPCHRLRDAGGGLTIASRIRQAPHSEFRHPRIPIPITAAAPPSQRPQRSHFHRSRQDHGSHLPAVPEPVAIIRPLLRASRRPAVSRTRASCFPQLPEFPCRSRSSRP